MKEHPGQPPLPSTLTEKDLLLPDGAAQTACQLACPMGAITFGNVLDPAAAVSRAKSLPRHRSLLSSLARTPERDTWPRPGIPTPPWKHEIPPEDLLKTPFPPKNKAAPFRERPYQSKVFTS